MRVSCYKFYRIFLCSDEIADFQGSDLFDAFVSNEKIQACTIYYTILYDNFIHFDSWLTLIYSVYDSFLDMPSVVSLSPIYLHIYIP